MRGHRSLRRSLAPLALGLCVWLLSPAQALARALVRFVHAVPGAGTATVEVNSGGGDQRLGSLRFAQTTPWRSIRSGSFRWTLIGSGGKKLAAGTSSVAAGAYDIVVLDKPSGISLGVYKTAAAAPGTSLVRVIHAAPELGAPQLNLDSKAVLSRLSFTSATPYLSVKPGTHTIAAVRPGDSAPLFSAPPTKFESGTAYSAIIVGSRGERVRMVTVVDRGAPLTRPASRTTGTARASGPATAAASTFKLVVIHPGDSLWVIARRVVGPKASNDAVQRKLAAIWALNANRIGTGDPNLIFAGQTLHLP